MLFLKLLIICNALLYLTAGSLAQDADLRKDSVLAQITNVLGGLEYSVCSHWTPAGFWDAFKDYDGQPIDVREHQVLAYL